MAGMYTLMAFIVAQRRHEVGLRCALGAQPGRLVMGIFGRALVPLVIGASAGCLVALLIDSSVQVEEVGGLTRERFGRHAQWFEEPGNVGEPCRLRRQLPQRPPHQPR